MWFTFKTVARALVLPPGIFLLALAAAFVLWRRRPLLARSFDVCQDAFREAGMKPTAVDSVVLVGGSTRMPTRTARASPYQPR